MEKGRRNRVFAPSFFPLVKTRITTITTTTTKTTTAITLVLYAIAGSRDQMFLRNSQIFAISGCAEAGIFKQIVKGNF